MDPEKAAFIPYNVNKNAQLQEKCITTFNRSERVRPSQVSLKDYTFKKPNWAAQFDATATDAENQRSGYEHYDFPGRFKDARGKQYSQYRLESLRQDAHLGWGESNSPALHPGTLFHLQNHPNDALNTFWQLTEIDYRGQQPQSSELEAGDKSTTLTNRFSFIPRNQTWRAPQQTKPRVDGPQMAIVVGPAGEEIYTDKYGRIRVQFLWDREGQYNDHSSCWIRVTQPWAGKGWGMMAIPRIGHEVLVDFLEGDPDQPMVTGRTYHANMPLPAGFPNAKPQMDLMSQTHKGGGHNGIMMDDSTNGQRLNLHAQRDMNTIVKNNRSTTVQGNHTETVVGNQSIQVNKTRYKEVMGDESTSIEQNAIINVGKEYKLLVQGNVSIESVENDIKLSTAEAKITLSHGGNIDIEGKAIQFNGEAVHLNPRVEEESENAEMSEGKAAQGDVSKAWTLTKNASSDGYIHNNQNGVDSKATAFTATYDKNSNGSSVSAKLLDMSIDGKYLGVESKLLNVNGYGALGNGTVALGANVTGAEIVFKGKVGDEDLGFKGELRGSTGKAGAGFRIQGHGGEKNIYGAEVGGELKSMASEVEAKGELLTRYFNVKGGVSKSAGSIGGDLSGKALADVDKGSITVGVAGKAAVLLGLGADVEAELNYKNICRDIDLCNDFFGLD